MIDYRVIGTIQSQIDNHCKTMMEIRYVSFRRTCEPHVYGAACLVKYDLSDKNHWGSYLASIDHHLVVSILL